MTKTNTITAYERLKKGRKMDGIRNCYVKFPEGLVIHAGDEVIHTVEFTTGKSEGKLLKLEVTHDGKDVTKERLKGEE